MTSLAQRLVPRPEAVRADPFPHFVVAGALPGDLADAMLEWLDGPALWHLHTASFFDQYELDLTRTKPAAVCDWLFDPAFRRELTERVGALYGVPMTDRITVSAHRLIAGQKIGIHTDEPRGDAETHRLVLQLNRGWRDEWGGHLVLFGDDDPDCIRAVIRPLHNTSIGFALSHRSFHAVAPVAGGVRYTLIFSFWSRDGAARGEPEHASLPGREAALQFLRSAGAGRIPHSGASLLDHLVGVERVLDRWGYPKDVRLAGLFHSVYGTEGFPVAAATDREAVRALIGTRAEGLVQAFCAMSRDSLADSVARGEPVLRTGSGSPLPTTWTGLVDLVAIDLANIAEQLPRLREDMQIVADDLDWYKQARPLLKRGARGELDTLFACLSGAGETREDGADEAAICAFLEEAGADSVVYSGGSLMAHLTGMRDLLRGWGCRPALVLAGLAHGIYGWRAELAPGNRALLRTLLGEEVERLAYLFAALSAEELAAALDDLSARPGADPTELTPALTPAHTGERVHLARAEAGDLATLEAAHRAAGLARGDDEARAALARWVEERRQWLPAGVAA